MRFLIKPLRDGISVSNGTTTESASTKRVDAILRMARREVGLRDVVTFGVSTIWSVLFVMGATSASVISHAAESIEAKTQDE